jgi:uncharacterized repeat protein (TIGR01451 family)
MKGFARLGLGIAVLGLAALLVALMLSGLSSVRAEGDVDLAVKIEAPDHVAQGAEYQIRIAYRNEGTEVAPDAWITATLPAGTEFISATDRWGVPLPPDAIEGDTFGWSVPVPSCNNAPDACYGHVWITVQVGDEVPDGTELTAVATISTTAIESDLTDNEASAVSVVCAMAGSGKQVSAQLAMPGDVLTYTLTVTQSRYKPGNPWESVVITDRLPFSHQVRFLGWAGTVTGTVHDGNTLQWKGQVRYGEPLQLQYRLGIEGVVTPGTPITNAALLQWQNQVMQLGPITTVVTLPHGALALGPYEGGQVHHSYGVTLTVPPGAISDTTRFQIGPLYTATHPTDPPPGLMFAHRAFEMNAFRFGEPVAQFGQPLTITLRYRAGDVQGLKRETLRLWTRSGPGEPWAMLGEPARVMSGTLEFTTTHFSQFALFGNGQYQLYLPVIRR